MLEGEVFQLDAAVDAPVAVNKTVIYESSNSEVVTVDATGKLIAISEGTAIITVTTVSGGLTDTCTITVEKGQLPISFDLTNVEGYNEVVSGIGTIIEVKENVINLFESLSVADNINKDDVVIKIQSGSSATLEDGILTFTRANGLITIRAYVGDENNPTALAELKLVLKN